MFTADFTLGRIVTGRQFSSVSSMEFALFVSPLLPFSLRLPLSLPYCAFGGILKGYAQFPQLSPNLIGKLPLLGFS